MMLADQSQFRLDLDIAVEPDFDFQSSAFRDLYAVSKATAFQAPLWLHTIHKLLVSNLNARQYTVTVRNRADGALLAVFPFVLQKAFGITMVQPADFGVCDYNAVIATTEMLETLAGDCAALDALDKALKAGGLLLFRKVRNDGFDVSRLFRKAAASPSDNAAHHCVVDDDFDQWRLKTLSRHMTKELGRKARQLVAEHGAYVDRSVQTEAEVRAALQFIKSSRVGRFEDDLLQIDTYFDFYLAYALAASQTGEACLRVSYVHDQPIAALFGLQGDGEFHAVLIAADMENYGRYSPGTQIIYRTIQDRFATGGRLFDMCLGNSGYKSHFRVQETGLRNFTSANSLVGASIATVYNRAKPLKNWLKKYTPHVH